MMEEKAEVGKNPIIPVVEATKFTPFLAPHDKSRVQAKYENASFDELFEGLKRYDNDAILYIMDKYDPLLNSIHTKFSNTMGQGREYSQSMSIEDWKNEVYMYLSGAGSSQPFFNKFVPQMPNPTEEYKWKSFSMYLKHYLVGYFKMIFRQQNQQMMKATSLNKPAYSSEEGDAPDAISQVAAPEINVKEPEIKKSGEVDLTQETLNQWLENFLLLLKDFSKKHKYKGKMMYICLSLRTKGKSFDEIAKITGVTKSSVYKGLQRARGKWEKYLKARKAGKPGKVEKKTQSGIPVRG
jgi:hypothetical protein